MAAPLIPIISRRRYFVTALIVFVVFLTVYLASTGFLVFAERSGATGEGAVAFTIADNWPSLMLEQRTAFLFEAIGTVRAGDVKLFISPLNILLGALLGALAALNIAVSYYSFRQLGLRGGRGVTALIGTLPAILSGAACCAPTLVLVVGLQVTAGLTAIFPFFVPVSFVLLVASLWWSLHKLEIGKL